MSNVVVPIQAVEAVLKQTGRFVRPVVEPRLIKEFRKIKKEMLSEFDNHSVTQELVGKTGSVPSAFVSHGSLFGFIGFDESDSPTEIVREMLNESELKFIKIKDKVVNFRIFYPSKEDLFSATPLPWATGRSWLKGIESGMSGLGRYLNEESSASRSGGGIQSEGIIRSGRFRNSKYISEILHNFIKKIDNLSL